jgi:trimeric autotransporter adhesin
MSVPAYAQTDTNTKLGTDALKANESGEFNTALGAVALAANKTGSHNTATGRRALYKNVTGDSNVAVGAYALEQNGLNMTTPVSNNTGVGYLALRHNISGTRNTAVGANALEQNGLNVTTPVGNNTGVGYYALKNNASGTGNTAVGAFALVAGGLSNNNTAVGYGALLYATGMSNSAVGVDASACIACSETTTMGHLASAGGSGAVAVGHRASAEGTKSIALGGGDPLPPGGVPVGIFTKAVGSNSIAVGYGAQAWGSNSMALGSGAVVTSSNTVRIGNSAITSISGQVAFTNPSDGRYKTNVRENVPGLEFIGKLKPVTFKWDLGKLNKLDGLEELASDPVLGGAREAKAKKVYTGFIAQDVEAAAQECGYDFSGVHKPANEQSEYSLAYADFVVPLVKAVQEQQKEIEELQKTVRALATDSRLPSGRLGAATAPTASQHAGVLGNFWGGAMTLLSAGLVLMHLKRRRESAATR